MAQTRLGPKKGAHPFYPVFLSNKLFLVGDWTNPFQTKICQIGSILHYWWWKTILKQPPSLGWFFVVQSPFFLKIKVSPRDWTVMTEIFCPNDFFFWAGEPSQKKPKSYNQNRWSSFGFQVLGYLLRGYLLIKGLLKIIHKLLAKWPRFHVKKSSLFAGSGASQYVYIYICIYIYKHTMGYKIYFQCRGNIFYFSISLFIYHAFTYWFIYLSKSVYLFSYLFIELFIYMLAPPPRHIFCRCHYLTGLVGKVPPCPTPGCLPTSTRVEPCFTAAP